MPIATRPVELRRMEARTLRALGEPCGVIVFDPASGEAAFRLRRDWDDFAGEEAPTLAALAQDLELKYSEMGPREFFSWIDSSLSASLAVDDMRPVAGRSVDTLAQALYRQTVHSTLRRHVTHLPLYSIRAAAGGFGPDSESEIEDWIEVHGSKPLKKDEFVLRITGRSMEPDIPDGSLCLFRRYSAGSRSGQIVLVQRITGSESGGEVTIKRYSSQKRPAGGSWEHDSIGMLPENPEFSAWQLQNEEGRHITIAVFERVLEEPLAGQ
jgi:SOS-response transcriptional repressor LexA